MLPENLDCRARPNWSASSTHNHDNAVSVDELKTDLKLLLECLKYHENDPDILKDGLLTVSSICLQNSIAQDCFRESGGLNYVLNLLTSTDHATILESAMYTLGCATERNIFSQKRLCNKAVFRFLECNLVNQKASIKLKRTVAYLLLCIVTNNSSAQVLINTSHCLDALLVIFRTQFPGYKSCPDSPKQFLSDTPANSEDASLELWTAVTSTLTGCVNNPQNDANQRQCASVFAVALDILRDTKNLQVIRLLASFLSLTTANNSACFAKLQPEFEPQQFPDFMCIGFQSISDFLKILRFPPTSKTGLSFLIVKPNKGKNQDRLGMLCGMDIIVHVLEIVVEALIQNPSPDATDAAVRLASLLVSCVTDNEWNKLSLGDLKAVPLLVQLLALDVIDTEVKLKIILTLGHLTEGCELNQRQMVESDGLGLVVHTMTGQQDEEYTKAATYLLHTCVKAVNSSEDAPLAPDVTIEHKSTVTGAVGREQPISKNLLNPVVKPKKNLTKVTSSSVTSYEKNVSALGTISPQKVAKKAQQQTSQKHKQVDRTDKMTANDSTIEALYKEISARKQLELKLRNEIKNRETLEAEKLELKKREEEHMAAENMSKQKAQAITEELERQYVMAQVPDVIYSENQSTNTNSKLNHANAVKVSNLSPTQSSNMEVQALKKKVEQLNNKLQDHMTNEQYQHNLSTLCASCGSSGSIDLSLQHTMHNQSGSGSLLSGGLSIDEMGSPKSKKTSKGRSDEGYRLSSEKNKKEDRKPVTQTCDMSVKSSPLSIDTISTSRSSRGKRFNINSTMSPIPVASPQGSISHVKYLQRVGNSDNSKALTANIRYATKPQKRESVFRLPTSAIVKKRKPSKQQSRENLNNIKSNEIDKTRSSTPRPTYAEEVLPYKQQKYTSPKTLLNHLISSSTHNDSDLESILSDITDCYSVADSQVSWSDVKLNLPVRPVGKKSRKKSRSKQVEEKAYSIKSSNSARSKRSYVVRYVKSHTKDKGRLSDTLTSPNSSNSILRCPGCDPPVYRPLLTSRNFLYTLEKSRHTCPRHREVQKAIKEDINNRKKLLETSSSQVCDTSRDASVNPDLCTPNKKFQLAPIRSLVKLTPSSLYRKRQVVVEESSPSSVSSTYSNKDVNECNRIRRKRQDFTKEEVDNLIAGVKKSGKHWNYILWAYRFKPGRTAIDLKDKYRRMQAQYVPGVLPKSPVPKKTAKKRLYWS